MSTEKNTFDYIAADICFYVFFVTKGKDIFERNKGGGGLVKRKEIPKGFRERSYFIYQPTIPITTSIIFFVVNKH